MITKKYITASAIILSLSISLLAYAENRVELGTSVQIDAQTQTESTGHVDASGNREMGDDSDQDNNSNSQAATTGLNANGMLNANINQNADEHASDNAAFKLFQNDIGRLTIDVDSQLSKTPGMITSNSDLTAYAQASMKDDKNIQNVSVTDSEVSMKYREPAKFLGFIPGAITAKVTVDSDGSVTVRYPWYRFLMKVPEKKADLESDVKANVGTVGSVSGSFTVSTKAQILKAVREALYRVRNSASAEVNAEAKGSLNY